MPSDRGTATGKKAGYGADGGLLPESHHKAEFERLIDSLSGTEKWDAGTRLTYHAFFMHGWYGRAGTAAYQQECCVNDHQARPDGVFNAEFAMLLTQLSDPDKWEERDRATYFDYFLQGWFGRAGKGAFQVEHL